VEQPTISPHDDELVAPAGYDELRPPEDEVSSTAANNSAVTGEAFDPTTGNDLTAALNEAPWAIATPGRPVILPQESHGGLADGGWRVSNEPVARVAPSTAIDEVTRTHAKEVPATIEPLVEQPEQTAVVEKELARPAWSAKRGGNRAVHVSSRPGWSANR
jgi:hypothetical protein